MKPSDLQGALAKALGDPDLVVGYPTADGYTDLDGQPVSRSQSMASIERDGRQVAVLIYDRSLDDDPELVDAVTAAATIALENQHLNAEAQQRLAEVESSRERIIAAGDAERRRIERNLHDGAQQGLVTLAMQLSLIQRQIRHNPADAEQLVASEALANAAKYAHATTVTIRLFRTDPHAVIEITDDGIGGADPSTGTGLRGLTDRVETLRGHLTVTSPPDGGTTIRASLPTET